MISGKMVLNQVVFVQIQEKEKGQLISCPQNVNPQTHKQYRTYCTTNLIKFFN